VWEEQMMDWGYECRKRHDDCSGWVQDKFRASLGELPDLRPGDAGGGGRPDPVGAQ
jgi:hypothetical protein